MTEAEGPERQRLDKWLWHARVVKTRSLAQRLVVAGKVRVNRTKVAAPSTPVRLGDVVTVALHQTVQVLRVAGFSQRRGPATLARTLYVDLSPPAVAGGQRGGAEAAGSARPDKRDRRRLLALKQFDS